MPVQSCTKNNKPGHKWGEEGFCYTGSNSEKLALEQGQAIQVSKTKRDNYYDSLMNIGDEHG